MKMTRGLLLFILSIACAGCLELTQEVWVNRDGEEDLIEGKAESYEDPKISPDGRKIALAFTKDGNKDIYTYDLDRKTPDRLTLDEANDFLPIWTHDGKRIIFASGSDGGYSIFSIAANRSGEAEQIALMDESYIWPVSLSKVGNFLFFGQWHHSTGGYNIGMLPIDGDRIPKPLLQEEYNESYPQISPDGRWLAYVSDESGQDEIYIRSFPDVDSGERSKASTEGGNYPHWSDDLELYYESLAGEMMVVSIETEPELKPGKPQRLFDMGPYLNWDIDPDGKRFLMVKEVRATVDDSVQGNSRKIIIVTNWFEELKEKVPVE